MSSPAGTSVGLAWASQPTRGRKPIDGARSRPMLLHTAILTVTDRMHCEPAHTLAAPRQPQRIGSAVTCSPRDHSQTGEWSRLPVLQV
eukprot:scaffold31514_cov114-Isochrysis_galbana.AAC.9